MRKSSFTLLVTLLILFVSAATPRVQHAAVEAAVSAAICPLFAGDTPSSNKVSVPTIRTLRIRVDQGIRA
jgi:hypothetical protein